jgi:hypothetical protein
VYETHQNYSEPNTNVLAHKTDYPTNECPDPVYETQQNYSEPNTNVLAHKTDYHKIVSKHDQFRRVSKHPDWPNSRHGMVWYGIV